MKNGSSVFQWAFAVATATSFCVGAPTRLDSAQDTVKAAGGDAGPPRDAQAPPIMCQGVSEVVKMYRGGVDKDVILYYISNMEISCHLKTSRFKAYLFRMDCP
jgi:hypothetical protein